MKDILTWECYEGCDCKEQGHIHITSNDIPEEK